MTDKEPQDELPYDPIVEAIRILARRGRRLREAPLNAVYEGMTDEERGIAVYEKVKRGELEHGKMTLLEHESWSAEIDRQMRELLEDARSLNEEYKRLNNALWNDGHHRSLMERIESIWDKLNDREQKAILELLQSCRWGKDEVEQVKEIVGTAAWFSKLQDG